MRVNKENERQQCSSFLLLAFAVARLPTGCHAALRKQQRIFRGGSVPPHVETGNDRVFQN